MTKADVPRFEAAFDRLVRAIGRYFEGATKAERDQDRIATELVYFDSLRAYGIESVERAERRLRIEGTERKRFPLAPEWGALAHAMELEILAADVAHQLEPSPEVVAAEVAAARARRDQLVQEWSDRDAKYIPSEGVRAICEFFTKQKIQHPSADPEAAKRELERRVLELRGRRRQHRKALPAATTGPRLLAGV